MMAAGLLAASSCTDFADYNETPADAQGSANQTLWENIQQRQDLSSFRNLLQKAGFDKELANTRAYTVWAPADGTFDAATYEAMSNEDLLNKFVKNHVAEYNYPATGTLGTRVHTLNAKSYEFAGTGNYTFGGIPLKEANVPGNNGVMHVINGSLPFYSNIYEYLKTAPGLDSLRVNITDKEEVVLDEKKSVKGPIVNGIQTWIDSVVIINNPVTRRLNAKIENEDSTYTLIAPTNEAFAKMYNEVKLLYNYIDNLQVQTKWSSGTASTNEPLKLEKSAAVLSDSMAHREVLENLILNNNSLYNRWLKGEAGPKDTLMSTTYTYLSNPDSILDPNHQVGEKVMLSNGQAYIMDKLAFHPWETYNPELFVNPLFYVDKNYFASNISTETLPDSLIVPVFKNVFKNPNNLNALSSFEYLKVEINQPYAKPDVQIALPNVLSGEYNFYVVFLPAAMEALGKDTLPNLLNFTLNYCNEKGTLAKYNFTSSSKENPATQDKTTAFTNDPSKTDIIHIGKFKFPVAYRRLGDKARPYLRIHTPINPYPPSTDLEFYTRTLRIAYIILTPVDYDNFKQQNNI